MTIFWGVDSARRAIDTLPSVPGNPKLFDYITQREGSVPQFWGRYITGAFALTPDEVGFLLSVAGGSCRILLIYNGAAPGGDFQRGIIDATNAINAAQNLGAPTGVSIYADIEANVFASPGWMLGWWTTMSLSVYANPGGFYCNPLPTNASFFGNSFCSAITNPTNVSLNGGLLFDPPLYSSEPQNVGCSFNKSSFQPAFPSCGPIATPFTGSVIWQYATTCYQDIDPQNGLVDKDLANDKGYATMWSGIA